MSKSPFTNRTLVGSAARGRPRSVAVVHTVFAPGATVTHMDDSEPSANVGAGDDTPTDRSPESGDNARAGDVDDDGASVGDHDGSDGPGSLEDDVDVADADATDGELPGPPLGESRGLNPRVQLLWSVQVVVLAALLGGLARVATTFDLLPAWVGPAVGGVVLVAGGLLVRARFRRWRYEVRADAIYLDRGVVTQVRTVVPLVRVQHTDTARDPFERALGLASTVVYTAGSRGSDVRVPGLTPEGARELRERLKRLAILNEGEDAV